MGFGHGSTTETKVETGELSARGMEYDSLFQSMLMQELDKTGWEPVSTQEVKYEDPARAQRIQDQISGLNDRLAQISTRSAGSPGLQGGGRYGSQSAEAERRNVENELAQAQMQLDHLPQTSYTKWDIKEKPDIRVQDAIDKYGENSPQAQALMAQVKQEKVDQATAMAQVNSDYLVNLQKFVSGDMSFTPEQKAQIEALTAPYKDVIMSTTDDLLRQAQGDNLLLGEKLDQLSFQIDKTGFAIGDALKAAGIQIDQLGGDLLSTLQRVNTSGFERIKFEQGLVSEQIAQQTAQQAALLGLPPGSQLEKYQRTKLENDWLSRSLLQLTENEARGELGIKQYIGGEKQKISFANIGLEESQGAKREQVAKMDINATQNLAQLTQQILANRGNALLGLEGNKTNMLQQAAYGGIPNILGVAQGAGNFQQQQAVNAFNLGFAPMSQISGQLGVEQQRQLAETTTTQHQDQGFLGSLSDIVGIGAGVAGAVFSGGTSLAVQRALNRSNT